MSVKIMTAIFESKTLGPTERLVMLALADHADDEGRCYPSVSRLCDRTGLSERAVQTNVKALVASGYLTVLANAGPGGANVYIVRPTPAADAPPQEMHPAGNAPRRKCTTPPQEMRPTPAADAPKPSGTIIEPSKDVRPTFEAFWERWPNRSAKAAAEKAWGKLSAQQRAVAVEKCATWFEAWRKSNPSASPILPASFLNGKRWEDASSEKPETKDADVAAFWAERINADAFVMSSAIRPEIAREMIQRGLVSAETMKRRGFAA